MTSRVFIEIDYNAHRYDVGDWYNPHSDFYPIDQYSSLKLTCIVSLNDDYEGGEFKFFDGKTIEQKPGRLIIHPCICRTSNYRDNKR